jgi:hypothetical protein
LLHDIKSLVNILQSLAVGNELINLELALQVVINQVWKLRAAFDSTKGTTTPDTASDKLECWFC